jgi:hypothetical protein
MNVSELRCPSCTKPMQLTRATCRECGITIEGNLEISPLARLSREDQDFVIAFLRSGGNLSKTGDLFGISYPTVKVRLAALLRKLVHVERTKSSVSRILDRLEKGDIDVKRAMELLK